MVESLRLAIQMIAPIMPGIHEKVNGLMGLKPCEVLSKDDLNLGLQTDKENY